MNYDLACREIITNLGHRLPAPKQDDEGLSAEHAHWMMLQIQMNQGWSDSKKGRWLGWIQAVLCQLSFFELDEMKALNRACSCDDEGCPQFGRTHVHDDKPAKPADHTGKRDSHT